MKRKTNKPTTQISLLSFSRVGKKDFRTLLSWRERGLSEKMKLVLMEEYYEWAFKPKSLDYLEFLNEQSIPVRTFQDWFGEHPDLKEVHEAVKTILGVRFQMIARFPKQYNANPDPFEKTLRFYHPDWRAVRDEEDAARTKSNESNKTIIAVLEKYPDEELEAVES